MTAPGAQSDGSRWVFPLRPEHAPPPPRGRFARLARPLAVVCLALALVIVAVAKALAVRALLPVALALVAVGLLYKAGRASRARRGGAQAVRARELEVSEQGIRLLGHRDALALLPTTRQLGVTLVSNRRRDRLVAAVTCRDGAFYVGTDLGAAERGAFAELLLLAHAVSSDDWGLEAIGPDGGALTLPPGEFAAFLERLGAVSPGCLERCVLSDARGAPVLLDGGELRVGERVFDLASPLEWRPLLFQETFGHAVAVYQGTWVRQASQEIVLVSLLPSVSVLAAPIEDEPAGHVELDRAALRDLRLMQASPEDPPPNELRVAIDRLFMLPLRAALDRAPRPSSQPLPAHP